MRKETTADVVARMFGAAHWQVGESDLKIWHEALTDMDDALGLMAAKELVANVDLANDKRPSPALIREAAAAICARRRGAQPALPEDTSPVSSPETRAAAIAEMRAQLAKAKGPLAAGLRRTAAPMARAAEGGNT